MSNDYKLTLGSELCAKLREDFDTAMSVNLLTMARMGVNNCMVTLKVTVDNQGEVPVMTYKVSSSIKDNDSCTGMIRKEGTSLAWSDKAKCYVLRETIPPLLEE